MCCIELKKEACRMKNLMLTGRYIDVMSAEFEQTPRGHETVQIQVLEQIAFRRKTV